mgnify:CR=1 FL=1
MAAFFSSLGKTIIAGIVLLVVILLAVGGFIPSVTSGLNRFGFTQSFFLGEFLGVVFLFLGFLASIEVFREFRVPFTNKVLRARGAE